MTESREKVHNAIQDEAEPLGGDPGALLVGWYLVSEWVDTEGKRWLSRAANQDSSAWQRMGYLKAGLTSEEHLWSNPSDD